MRTRMSTSVVSLSLWVLGVNLNVKCRLGVFTSVSPPPSSLWLTSDSSLWQHLSLCFPHRCSVHPWVRVRALAATWCPAAALVWVLAWAPSSWASSRMETPSLKATASQSCTDVPVLLTTRPQPTVEGTLLFCSLNVSCSYISYIRFILPHFFRIYM